MGLKLNDDKSKKALSEEIQKRKLKNVDFSTLCEFYHILKKIQED